MPLPLATLAIPTILGIGVQAASAEGARAATEEGARGQARIEALKREALQKQFEQQIERQQPFLEAGVKALPQLTEAISGRGDVSALPATRIQGDLIAEFLGDEAPDFIKNRAATNLEAVELERQKGRLADLVSAGAGGAVSATGSRVDLGTTLGRSASNLGSLQGQSLQQQAIQRQNLINQTVGQLAGLPALYAASQGPSQDFQITTPSTISGFEGGGGLQRGTGVITPFGGR